MNTDHLIRMANQIAAYYASYPDEEARKGVQGHIQSFWEPSMREQLRQYLEDGGEGLAPTVRSAFETGPEKQRNGSVR